MYLFLKPMKLTTKFDPTLLRILHNSNYIKNPTDTIFFFLFFPFSIYSTGEKFEKRKTTV